jgi:hypothetical protein
MCGIGSRQGPECGTVQKHFSPELLPKEVCPRAVVRAIYKEMQPLEGQPSNLMRALVGRHFRLGSLYFELACYRDAHPAEGRSGALDRQKAEEQFDAAAQRSPSKYAGALNSCIMRLFMPYADQMGQPLEQRQAWGLQDGLSDLIRRVTSKEGSVQRLARGKLGPLLLFSTRGILAMPSTAREGGKLTAVNTRVDDEYAHDFYIVDPVSGRKVPHRLVPEDRVDNTAYGVRTNFDALAMEALEEVSPQNVPASTEIAGKLAITLLHDYVNDRVRDESSLRVLDTMGMMAEEQVRTYTENNLR